MKINWTVRIRNKFFWLAMIPAVLLLVKLVLEMAGLDFDIIPLEEQLTKIVETVFTILAITGVVNDPTTSGISDSANAMNYEVPKKDIYAEG